MASVTRYSVPSLAANCTVLKVVVPLGSTPTGVSTLAFPLFVLLPEVVPWMSIGDPTGVVVLAAVTTAVSFLPRWSSSKPAEVTASRVPSGLKNSMTSRSPAPSPSLMASDWESSSSPTELLLPM